MNNSRPEWGERQLLYIVAKQVDDENKFIDFHPRWLAEQLRRLPRGSVFRLETLSIALGYERRTNRPLEFRRGRSGPLACLWS
jgi:hypothetical protein